MCGQLMIACSRTGDEATRLVTTGEWLSRCHLSWKQNMTGRGFQIHGLMRLGAVVVDVSLWK